jgi:drug/metabolite transporter (DMT)-like permease
MNLKEKITPASFGLLQASLLVALSGILYGLMGFLGSKIIGQQIDIASMLFWRFFIAGIWMIPFVFKKRKGNGLRALDKKQLRFILLLAPLGYAGGSGFYFLATTYAGTGLSMVIFFTYPIIIALFSWLVQKYPLNGKTFFMLFAISVGLVLLSDMTGNEPIHIMGLLFSFAAAASYAFYIIGSKKYSASTLDSNLLTMVVSFGSAFVFLIAAFAAQQQLVIPASIKSWGYLVGLGVFATALPIQFMLEGLKKISSMRASIISVLEPLVTVFIGILLLDESLSLLQVCGIIIVLMSTIAIQFQREV